MALQSDLEKQGIIFRPTNERTIALAKVGPTYGNTFLHENYIRANWEKQGAKVIEYLSGGLRGWQDIVILSVN